MEKNPIHEFIEQLPFFQEFLDDEKAKLVNTFGIFEKYKEGESGSALFVVLTGSIRITKSTLAPVQEPEEVTIAELKAGSIFGEISLISNRPRNSNALADSPQVVVIKITTEIIEKFNLRIQKKFQAQLILTLVQRLDDMNSKFIKLKSTIQKD